MLSVSFSASLCYTPLLFVYDSGFAELKLLFLQVFCLKESEMKSRVTIYCLLGIMLVEIIQWCSKCATLTVIICEIKLFWNHSFFLTVVTREIKHLNNLKIISVFHFTCNHDWKWDKIISAAVRVLKLFQNYFGDIKPVGKYSWAAIVLRNNFEIISGKNFYALTSISDRRRRRLKWFWNNFISHVTTAMRSGRPLSRIFQKNRLAEPYFRLISGLAEFLRKLRNSAENAPEHHKFGQQGRQIQTIKFKI